MTEDFISEIKIFYVEDEPFIREGFVRFLKRRTDKLYVFSNGQEALDAFSEIRPDLIITDIRMPVMDGLEMSEKIKEIDPSVPIIVTTGHNDEDFFLRSIDIGIDKYIKKPVSFTELIGVVKKITSSIVHERQMEKHNKFLREVMDLNPNFVITTDGSKCTYLNESFKEFLGCTTVSEYIEKYGNIKNVMVEKEDTFYKGKEPRQWLAESTDSKHNNRMVFLRPLNGTDDDEMVCLANVKNVPDKDEWLISFADVTLLEKEKQIYRMLSQQDPLTKIYNRTKFFEEVEKELDRVSRYGQDMSILMIDVDYFKEVNDQYGHLVGDKVLIELTQIIRQNIRKSDVFARYGGEEFALLMPMTAQKGAREKADLIREAVSTHNFDKCGRVTCSFGVATYAEGDTVDSFVQKADIALYNAKESGRNMVQVFEEGSIKCSH
ncbi:diguanylate cyclase [Denitrovibrio acetiphilus DSM 12809]|uniref:diguanylate cyclase n=1 Tax=Denitrovibrio acetiphilus (strain DSM 12809 / NBRC 114555 / N2460) TaxID=522772 RepID=D4H0U4_DENA2|nr:diguanylate cyclase [Denitrovibrio acetiphilus]ADD68607.1 diguanylate cyclase [Denitrovibrio acetiphilus DSM 12809]